VFEGDVLNDSLSGSFIDADGKTYKWSGVPVPVFKFNGVPVWEKPVEFIQWKRFGRLARFREKKING
jgi:hypothetical protein